MGRCSFVIMLYVKVYYLLIYKFFQDMDKISLIFTAKLSHINMKFITKFVKEFSFYFAMKSYGVENSFR
jgi:hypothetical protein